MEEYCSFKAPDDGSFPSGPGGRPGQRRRSSPEEHYTPAEIAAKLCTFRGKPYPGAEGGTLLSDLLCNSVSETIYERRAAASAEHADGLKALPSVNRSFHVRKSDGT